MQIDYREVGAFPGWTLAEAFLKELIERFHPRDILEIGAGANPTLAIDYVQQHGLTYTTNDLYADELAKADAAYEKLQLDFCDVPLASTLNASQDLIFSRMVNEHIRDGRTYYKNIFETLRPGGITAHCFSTLYALPFLANRLIPEFVADLLLDFFLPRDRHQHDKFKAYYSWSRGPTPRMIRNFESLGYEVIEYVGFYGHPYYSRRLPWLHALEQHKSRWLAAHPNPYLTSYAYVILRKPETA